MFQDKITDIFFDLDHTLWDFDKNSELAFDKIFKEKHPSINTKSFVDIYAPINQACWKLYQVDKLTHDDELAFIICHELAHYYFEHVDMSYIRSLNKLKSKETKEKIKAIKKSEYGTHSKGTSLFKGFMYDSRKHVRGHEYQADSLGLSFLMNTKWFSPLRFGQNYKGLLKIRLQYYLCVGKDDQWRPLYQWLFVTRRPTVTF